MRGWLVALMLLPTIGRAEDACKEDGNRVCCTRPGFDKLLGVCKGFQQDAAVCHVDLDSEKQATDRLREELDKCHVPVAPLTCPPPPAHVKQSGERQLWGYALAVTGTALVLAAPMFQQLGPGFQASTVTAGVVALGAGFVVNLTFD